MRKDITIFQQNDTHGCLDLHDELYWHGTKAVLNKAGGLARINQYVKDVKRTEENVLFFDGGDLFHGTLPLVQSEGEALIPILEQMELDGFVPGNWDFAYGKAQLKKLTDQLPFPTLACNVTDEETGSPFLTPYIIQEMSGLKVGIIGLTYGHEDKIMPESFSAGLDFTLGTEEVQEIIQNIRNSVDLTVVVSHLGLPLDVKLASMTNGIDIILSGHSHDRVTRPIDANGTIVVQAGSNAAFLGQLDISIENGKLTYVNYQLIDMEENLPEDPIIAELIATAMEPFQEEKNNIVGVTNTLLHRMTLQEAPMDKLITDAYLHAYDGDIAFSHGWRYGPPMAKGELSRYDLNSIIPTNPTLFTMEIEGKALLNIMEKNLDMVYSADPFEQKGGYVLRSSGLSLTYKPYSPKGYRIQTFHVGDNALDMHKTYKIVGAGGQLLKGFEQSKKYHNTTAINVIETFLKDNKKPFKPNKTNQIITV